MVEFIKSLVTIYAQDIERSADFYGRIMGFEETYRFPFYFVWRLLRIFATNAIQNIDLQT